MKQLLRIPLYVLALLALPLAAQAQFSIKAGMLQVPLIPQQTNSWCWAASGQMTMKYFGYNVSQCKQASYQFGQPSSTNCCASPTPGLCISGGIVEIGHYGFTSNQLGGNSALSVSQVAGQIGSGRPWILNPNGPGFGHVTVGVGFLDIDLGIFGFAPMNFVFINDPWPPNVGDFVLESHASYACGYWGGTCHTEGYDYYDIKPPKSQPKQIKVTSKTLESRLPRPLVERALNGDADPRLAATAAWEVLRYVLPANMARPLGVGSPDVMAKLHLGTPVEEYAVSIERLREWKGGAAEALVEKQAALFVPLGTATGAQANVRLRMEGDKWIFASLGGPNLSKAWERAHRAGGEFLVEIPGLELSFAGRRAGGQLLLSPLFTDPRFRLKAGAEVPAEKMLQGLVEIAKVYRPSLLAQAGR